MNNNILHNLIQFIRDMMKKGFFHLLSANLIINLFAFGSQLFVAKLLSSVDLGRIKTMQSYIALAVIAAGFGLNTAVLKLCSENRSFAEKEYILRENLNLTAFGTLLVVLIIFLLATLGYLSPDQEINRLMLMFMFYIPAYVFTSLIISYIQALNKIHRMAYVQVIIRLLGVIGLIIFTYYWKLPGYIYSSILFGFIPLFFLFRMAGVKYTKTRVDRFIVKTSLYYGKWSVASNGLYTLGTSIDILLMNFLITDRSILGDYGFATAYIWGMNQLTGTVQSIATPFFSAKSNNIFEFMRVFRKYQRLLILFAGSVTCLAIIFVPWFVKLVYEGKYPMSGVFFRILAIRYFFWSCYALLNAALIGLGRMKENFIASSIHLPITIIIAFTFISFWGPIGAAYAQALSSFVALGIVNLNFKRVMNKHYKML